MASRDSLLLVLDVPNLYSSAKHLYGRGALLDFRAIRKVVVGDRKFAHIYGVGYVSEIRDEPHSVANVLRKFGFDPAVRIPQFQYEIARLRTLMETYTVLAVASGDRAWIPLYDAARGLQRRAEAYSFPDAFSGDVPAHVDLVTNLAHDVLRSRYPTLASVNPDAPKGDGGGTP